jgi:CBS domain containing-hemolysin-like protein
MTAFIILAAMVLICIAVEAFFSGADIAFISANRARIWRRAKENNPQGILAKSLLSRPELLFSTTVVGTTLAISCSTTLATLYILRHFGPSKEWLNPIFLAPLILVLGEFVPKMICRANADRAVLSLARPLSYATFFLYPLTKLLSIYAQVLKRIVGESPEKSFFLSREEIKAALPASRGSDVTPSERALIERILEFGKITVREMLRPLIDIVAIEESQPLTDAVRLLSESGHSRLPVYQERIDRIVGVLQGFDCLRTIDLTQPVKSVMQPAFFVPESKPLDELLLELKTRPMAVAVNEFGGAEGIITMEDVIEEVVGEIEDEYDEPPRLFHQIGENSYIVSARMEVDDMRELLKIPVPKDEDYQTLAGFLLKRMQKIPKKWDSTVIDGVEYVVQSATDRSIEEVYIIVHQRQFGG